MLLHAQRQSFDAADNEPGIKCSQTGTGCFINQTQLIGNNGILGYGKAYEYIVVAAKIFGSAMDNDISAKVQRSLEIWCQEGIVDDDQKIIFVGDFADSTQITDFHCGVCRSFQKDSFGIGLNGSFNFFQFRSMHRGEL